MRVWIVLPILLFTAVAADHRIADAAKDQDPATLQSLLKQHADVTGPQGDGATALHWAAHWDDQKTAALLIAAGAKINAADDNGITPLSLACLNASAPMVEALLKAGANPNLASSNGETPLMAAAHTGSVQVIKLLLAAKADVKAQEASRGQTALMRAVASNHPEIAKALIVGGSDVKARSKNRFTAMLFAAQQGNLESARILLAAGADVNDTAPDGVGGDTNARTLFKAGTEAGALLVAIDSVHAEMAKFLIDHGADVNQHGAGRTPLHAAVQQSMPEVVQGLLTYKADPNARLEKPLPFLSRFIKQDSGLEVNPIGATAFWLAASYADIKTMRILADAGADPKLTSTDKTTPLMVAAGVDFVDGQDKYGHRWFQDGTLPLQKAAIDAVQLCLDLGLDINAANSVGQTAMHGAAYFGGTLVTQFLFDHGAKLDPKNRLGQTPFIVTQGQYLAGSFIIRKETGDLLTKLGADIHITAPHREPGREN